MTNMLTIKTATNSCYQTIDVVTDNVHFFGAVSSLLDYPKPSISPEQCAKDGVEFSHRATFFDDENNKIENFTLINDCRSVNVVFTETYRMIVRCGYNGIYSSTSVPEYVTDLWLLSRIHSGLVNVPTIPVNQLKIPKSLRSFYVSTEYCTVFTNFSDIDRIDKLTLRYYKFDNNVVLPQNIKHLELEQCTGTYVKLPTTLESVNFINCTFTEGVVTFPDGLNTLDIIESSMIINENFPDSITKCSIVNTTRGKLLSTPTNSINNWPVNLETLYLNTVKLNIPHSFPHRLKMLRMENCYSPNRLFPTEWPDSITSLTLKTRIYKDTCRKYIAVPLYWPRNCVTMNIVGWSGIIDAPLPNELPSSVTLFKSNDPHVIPMKWPDSLKTIKCDTLGFEINYPEKWPPNINRIKLSIHEKTRIPSILPDGLVKFEINSSNFEHIPNYWPASLASITAKFECGSITSKIPLFIRKSDVEKYRTLGIDITPQQLFIIMRDITNSVDGDYDSDDSACDACTWCGRS